MASTFSGIEIGKRSLNAHQQGLTTIGHNLGNASVEGYSRQRVKLKSTDPIYFPQLNREEVPGQIGQGVDVASVERIRDVLLDNRIIAQGSLSGYWTTRDDYLLQVERIHQEPYDVSVRHLMDRFWEGWQELSLHPDGMPERQAVLRRGEAAIDGINRRYTRLKEVRTMLDEDLRVSVGEVNGMLAEIRNLNEQIVKSEALGDNPNDLYDRRDLLVGRISEYLPVSVDNRDPDEFLIHTGGRHLIQGRLVHFLDTEPDPLNEGYSDVVWAANGEIVDIRGGKLGALGGLRDGDLRDEIRSLDEMALAFADMVNGVHRESWSASGTTGVDFFAEYPFVDNVPGNYDRDGDGEFDSTYVYRMTGIHTLDPKRPVGFAGTITLDGASGPVEVAYTAVDTVDQILSRINDSAAEVTARLDRHGRLEIRAESAANREQPDFVIRRIEDSGLFLSGYSGLLANTGPGGAYDWQNVDALLSLREGGVGYAVAPVAHPAGWLRVTDEISADPGRIASGVSDGAGPASPGDGRAALAMAQLRHQPVLSGRTATFDDWFADSAAEIGLKGEVAALTREGQDLVMKELVDLRESISGVNLDEEFAEMIKFQHGYNAAARFITTMDEMLETIINRLGV